MTALEHSWWGGEGPDNGTAVVMLHHGLGSVSTWKDFPLRVHQTTDLPVVAYSRAGYGFSPPPAVFGSVDFMYQGARNELPAFLTALDIDRPILVGHSDGASIAAIYAGTIGRDNTIGCALLAPHVFVEDCTVRTASEARHQFEEGTLREGLGRHHAEPDVAFRVWSESWLHPDFRAWNIEAEVSAIRCPVTVIQGGSDPYGTVEQARRIERALNGRVTTVELSDAGHEPHRDHSERVLEAIRDLTSTAR